MVVLCVHSAYSYAAVGFSGDYPSSELMIAVADNSDIAVKTVFVYDVE